ncbi:MAG: hypothetical protein ACPLTR_10945, partial [Thermacetogeniaceae bacterium]
QGGDGLYIGGAACAPEPLEEAAQVAQVNFYRARGEPPPQQVVFKSGQNAQIHVAVYSPPILFFLLRTKNFSLGACMLASFAPHLPYFVHKRNILGTVETQDKNKKGLVNQPRLTTHQG